MNKKIIIICVAVIAIAGGTAGITAAVTSANNEKEAASLVNEAVSSALAEASTEPTSEEISAQNIEAEITENQDNPSDSSTQPQVVYNNSSNVIVPDENSGNTAYTAVAEYGGCKQPKTERIITLPWGTECNVDDSNKCEDNQGVCWWLNLFDDENNAYYVDENDKVFQHDKDGNRIYID